MKITIEDRKKIILLISGIITFIILFIIIGLSLSKNKAQNNDKGENNSKGEYIAEEYTLTDYIALGEHPNPYDYLYDENEVLLNDDGFVYTEDGEQYYATELLYTPYGEYAEYSGNLYDSHKNLIYPVGIIYDCDGNLICKNNGYTVAKGDNEFGYDLGFGDKYPSGYQFPETKTLTPSASSSPKKINESSNTSRRVVTTPTPTPKAQAVITMNPTVTPKPIATATTTTKKTSTSTSTKKSTSTKTPTPSKTPTPTRTPKPTPTPHTHSWGNYIISKEPTCTSYGQKYRLCSTCSSKDVVNIDPTGHEYEYYDSYLSADGKKGYTVYKCEHCSETVTYTSATYRFGTNVYGYYESEDNTLYVIGTSEDNDNIIEDASSPAKLVRNYETANYKLSEIYEVISNASIISHIYNIYIENVDEIGIGFAYGLPNLKTITILSNSCTIGQSAFENCTKLCSLESDSISEYGSYSFYNTNISEVTLNKKVQSVHSYAFINLNGKLVVNFNQFDYQNKLSDGKYATYFGGNFINALRSTTSSIDPSRVMFKVTDTSGEKAIDKGYMNSYEDLDLENNYAKLIFTSDHFVFGVTPDNTNGIMGIYKNKTLTLSDFDGDTPVGSLYIQIGTGTENEAVVGIINKSGWDKIKESLYEEDEDGHIVPIDKDYENMIFATDYSYNLVPEIENIEIINQDECLVDFASLIESLPNISSN